MKMKKYLLGMTVALMGLASCSSADQPTEPDDSVLTPVTLSVNIPEMSFSRVNEDEANIPGKGKKIASIDYAIYDHLGTLVHSRDKNPVELEKDPDDHGHFTLKAHLMKQHDYTIYLWASADEEELGEGTENGVPVKTGKLISRTPYTFNPATKQVTVDYSKVRANDETCDAFFGKKTITVANEQTSNDQYTIILNRPFAQLNIMTNDSKMMAQEDKNIKLKSVSVTIDQDPGTYTLLNL